MMTILTVVQVLLAIAMIAIILVQRGPGASAGSGFGAGASATVFGSRGSGSFLTRTTAIMATVFFAISFLMAVLVSRSAEPDSEIDLGVMAGSAPATEEEVAESDVPTLQSAEPAAGQDLRAAPAETEDEIDDVPAGPVDPVRDTNTDDDSGGN